MPLFDFKCRSCGQVSEHLVFGSDAPPACPSCGADDLEKLVGATSSLTGRERPYMPGPGDTACCGSAPGQGGCAGPGSCCGKGPF